MGIELWPSFLSLDLFGGRKLGSFGLGMVKDGQFYREGIGASKQLTFEVVDGYLVKMESFADQSIGFETNFPSAGAVYDANGKLLSVMVSIEDLIGLYQGYKKKYSSRDVSTVEARGAKGESIMSAVDLSNGRRDFWLRGFEGGRLAEACKLATPNGFYDGPVPGMDTRLRAYIGVKNVVFGLSRIDGKLDNFFFKRFIDQEFLKEIIDGKIKPSRPVMGKVLRMVCEDINIYHNVT